MLHYCNSSFCPRFLTLFSTYFMLKVLLLSFTSRFTDLSAVFNSTELVTNHNSLTYTLYKTRVAGHVLIHRVNRTVATLRNRNALSRTRYHGKEVPLPRKSDRCASGTLWTVLEGMFMV